ncbi:MAG: biotin--[acetyl-CoA-carboxylase] ligase [Acidimicrobiia bacterium]
MATHYDIVHLSEVGTTQDEAALRHAATGRPTLVVADRQVAGRGRQGRLWEQPDRALFSSVAFRTRWDPEHRTLIPLTAGLVMCGALEERGFGGVQLKWPNDLVVAGRKVGGVLVELDGDTVTVGCGVNLFWRNPVVGAAFLYDEDPGPAVAPDLANRWAALLLAAMEAPSGQWQEEEYRSRSATLGRDIVWDEGSGRARDLGIDGALVVETPDGMITLHAGDVHLRGHR